MIDLKRNLSLFMLVGLLTLSPFRASAGAQSNTGSDDQPGVAADQPGNDQADDQTGAYDQPQADDNDRYGTNDEQEAQGQTAPPPSDQREMSRPGQDQRGRDQPGPTEPTLSENTPDAPARAARLQYMTGSVSIQPHGAGDWANGELNRPLTNGDNVWADKNSRAELSVGSGLIRIDSESSLTLTNIDQNIVQLQLHQGALILHVRRLFDNETYEVDTPNQAFTVSKPGDYRFDVDPNANTTVITIWGGEGKSTGNEPEVALHENEQVRFTGDQMSGKIHAAPRPDDFDRWASSRDERMDRSQSARYVSPDVPGYEDLDEYGSWKESPDYGPIWQPTGVAVGWGPYRYGHWIWVAPWGWTWVDDQPWGYAPFHYGRWVYWGGAWGWAPGPIYTRPYYAPALVAWFGGPRWGVSVGFGGGFGWCPLGFGEPYVPWYHVSRGYFNRVNITNTRITNVKITNVYNNTYINNRGGSPGGVGGGGGPYGPHSGSIHYANMRAPNGFTAVSRQTLVSGQRVDRNALRVSPNQMSRMTPVRALDARPTRTAVMGGARAAAAPPSRSFVRPTVNRMSPPNAGRSGFGNAGSYARSGSNAPRGNANVPSRPAFGNESRGPVSNGPSRAPEMSRSVPRPPSAGYSRGEINGGRGVNPSRPPASMSRGYSEPYSAGRPNAAPAHGGGAYGRGASPSRGASPNGGGSYGRSAPPAYGSGPSMPSSGGGPARTYGGGGRGPSYSGGGRSGGGFGGGGHATPAGGGHSSGGGGGRAGTGRR